MRIHREEPAAAATAAPTRAPAGEVAVLARQIGNRATAALVLARREAATAKPLHEGSRGPAVTVLQVRLNRVDEVDVPLEADSVFGPLTARALKQFKAAHGLGDTAVADTATMAALGEALAEDQDPAKVAAKLFALGAAAYERGRFQHAYDFFTQASTLVDRPALLFSRAQALRRAGGHRAEAVALYEAYLATDAPTRKADAESSLAELRLPAASGDEQADTAAAKERFKTGAADYEAGRYGRAADRFEEASMLADRPALLFSRAQALRKSGGHAEEAIALYEAYLQTEDPARRKDAEASIAELKGPQTTGDEAADTAIAKGIFTEGAKEYGLGHYGHAADLFHSASRAAARPALVFSEAQALRKAGGHAEEAAALYEAYAAAGGDRAEEALAFAEALRSQGSVY